jgi:hypothetical protein
MRTLQIPELAAEFRDRASSRQISPSDPYLSVYPNLLDGIKTMRPLDRRNVILISHCVFGWMPTQLTINADSIDAAVQILREAETLSECVSAEQIRVLARTFQTAMGTSVVAAAKILHFIAPDSYPVWDKHVAKRWGASANGKKAAEEYRNFTCALRKTIEHPKGKEACRIMRERLSLAGFDTILSDVRVGELIIFQGPR